MAMWNPWRGFHKHSEGCKYCYIHKGDAKRGIDTDNIVKTDNFETGDLCAFYFSNKISERVVGSIYSPFL